MASRVCYSREYVDSIFVGKTEYTKKEGFGSIVVVEVKVMLSLEISTFCMCSVAM
jgi:hypothetical protein